MDNNHMHNNVWDGITYPFPTPNPAYGDARVDWLF